MALLSSLFLADRSPWMQVFTTAKQRSMGSLVISASWIKALFLASYSMSLSLSSVWFSSTSMASTSIVAFQWMNVNLGGASEVFTIIWMCAYLANRANESKEVRGGWSWARLITLVKYYQWNSWTAWQSIGKKSSFGPALSSTTTSPSFSTAARPPSESTVGFLPDLRLIPRRRKRPSSSSRHFRSWVVSKKWSTICGWWHTCEVSSMKLLTHRYLRILGCCAMWRWCAEGDGSRRSLDSTKASTFSSFSVRVRYLPMTSRTTCCGSQKTKNITVLSYTPPTPTLPKNTAPFR